MDWAEFVKILKSRAVASQAVQILDGNTECTMSFKKEVGVVTNINKNCSYLASNCCNDSSSHPKDRRYGSSHDGSSSYRRSGSPPRRSDS